MTLVVPTEGWGKCGSTRNSHHVTCKRCRSKQSKIQRKHVKASKRSQHDIGLQLKETSMMLVEEKSTLLSRMTHLSGVVPAVLESLLVEDGLQHLALRLRRLQRRLNALYVVTQHLPVRSARGAKSRWGDRRDDEHWFLSANQQNWWLALFSRALEFMILDPVPKSNRRRIQETA